jgi:phospholipid/cholesterol/gamma-HCH transport system permease protein
MVGRSSSAFASELSTMVINGEVKNLRRMGISPLSYLIMPRVLGMTLAGIALAFYCQIVAVGTGWIVTAIRLNVLLSEEISGFFEIISYHEIAATLVKSALFGMLVAIVSGYHGLRNKTAMTEVPQAVSQAVIRSLLAVFVADGVVTVLAY